MNQSRRARLLSTLLNLLTGLAALSACAIAISRLLVDTRPPLQPPSGTSGRRVANLSEYTAGGIRLGSSNAAVTIVEFSDFKCPFCEQAAADIRLLRRLFPAEISLVYRQLPLHSDSFAAAVAAECASRSGRFESLHDRLFAQSDSIGSKSMIRFAIEVGGIDTVAFADCIGSKDAADSVARDTSAARRLGIDGTPTILVNETRFESNPGFERLRDEVTRALKRRTLPAKSHP